MKSTDGKTLTRTEQKEQTRRTLIETTIALIAEGGLPMVTMARVAERAGLSRGICNYHFTSKDRLLHETLKTVHAEHEAAWRKAAGAAELTPRDRLANMITALLTPPILDLSKAAVWLSFWGETPARKTYLDDFAALDREFEEAIEAILVEIAGGKDSINDMAVRAIAVSLTGIIDGFWLQFLIAPGRLSREEAIRSCHAYLSAFFPQFAVCGCE